MSENEICTKPISEVTSPEAQESTDSSESTVSEATSITCLFTGECPSVSGRSTLTFEIGRHPDQSLHLRIARNTGSGMFCDEWASDEQINAITSGAQALTSRSFNALHPGKSINTGGFVMSALRHLGLIRPSKDNTRYHEHIPDTTFESVVADVLSLTKGQG